MSKKHTFSFTSRQLTLLVVAVEEQVYAQQDEVRDAVNARGRKKAQRELTELENLLYHLTGDQT